MSERYAEASRFGLTPLHMTEKEYEALLRDTTSWMEIDVSPDEEARLRELLYVDVGGEPEGASGGDLLEEAIVAIRFAEAVMSEDVLSAVTGHYAADHNIYEAINKLKAVLERHGKEAVV